MNFAVAHTHHWMHDCQLAASIHDACHLMAVLKARGLTMHHDEHTSCLPWVAILAAHGHVLEPLAKGLIPALVGRGECISTVAGDAVTLLAHGGMVVELVDDLGQAAHT